VSSSWRTYFCLWNCRHHVIILHTELTCIGCYLYPPAPKSTRLPQNRPPPKKTLPLRQQLPLSPPPRVFISGRSRKLYPRMSAQTGLRPPPRRRHNNRLRGCPGGPGSPGGRYRRRRRHRRWRSQQHPQEWQGPEAQAGAIEAQLQSYYSANGA